MMKNRIKYGYNNNSKEYEVDRCSSCNVMILGERGERVETLKLVVNSFLSC